IQYGQTTRSTRSTTLSSDSPLSNFLPCLTLLFRGWRLSRLAGLAQRRLETRRELFGRPSTPVVEEIDRRCRPDHMVMNGHHIESVLPERLQYGRDLIADHGNVTGDRGVLIGPDESRPGVEPHARVDGRAHFSELQIVAADRDFVDRPVLLPFGTDDLGKLCGIERWRRSRGGCWSTRGLWGVLANEVKRGLDLPRQV